MDAVDLYDGLMTTRAMRRFSDEPVSDDEVTQILAAAVQAPSGGNIQPYQFVVVRDAPRRAEIGAIYLRAYDRYEPAVLGAFPPFTDPDAEARHRRNWAASRRLAETIGTAPPVLVLVVAPKMSMALVDAEGTLDVGSVLASVYPAVQNLILAARALGIGSCLTTVYKIYEDEVRAVCGIPDRYEIAALVPLGRPAGHWGIAPRRPASSITNWDSWGNRRG